VHNLTGIAISLAGVLTIILRGDFAALADISFNKGDVMFAASLVSFGLYSALIPRRPVTHQLSLISFTTCCGALMLLPFSVWEFSTGAVLKFDLLTAATLAYVLIFPSTLAYLFFNRGVALIGPNRAAPFFHLVPVFGSAMAIPAARRTAKTVSPGRLRAGAGRRRDRGATGIDEMIVYVSRTRAAPLRRCAAIRGTHPSMRRHDGFRFHPGQAINARLIQQQTHRGNGHMIASSKRLSTHRDRSVPDPRA